MIAAKSSLRALLWASQRVGKSGICPCTLLHVLTAEIGTKGHCTCRLILCPELKELRTPINALSSLDAWLNLTRMYGPAALRKRVGAGLRKSLICIRPVDRLAGR